jgi:hypothetical protein
MRLPRVRFSPWRLLVVGAPVAVIALLCSTAGPFRMVSGRGVSARVANGRLWNCPVPDDATDVWFTSSYRGTRLECSIKPESFRVWSGRNGRNLSPIPESEPACVASQRGVTQMISRGFRFNEARGDLGYRGLYDTQEKRAYVNYSGG